MILLIIFYSILLILLYSLIIDQNIYLLFSIILFLLLTILSIIYNKKQKNKYISHFINNNHINVLKNKPKSLDAAIIIQEVNTNLDKLIDYLNKKYNDINLDKLVLSPYQEISYKKKIFIRNLIKQINQKYKKNNILENFPLIENQKTSYNINKGEKIYLCLRNFINTEFHNMNEIMFVAIHELSHCCNHSKGHKKDFWYIFKFLLENAQEINIYQFKNYKKNPINYCSTKVTYNPIFDDKLKDDIYLQ